MKPKRFLCFDYPEYYPSGGWDDLAASYDTIEEAQAHRFVYPPGEIIDLETGQRWGLCDGKWRSGNA